MPPRSKPSTCEKCPLFTLGRGFLSSEGSGTNGVLIIGEAAGKHEAAQSLPFRPNAPAGGLLERMLGLSGLKRVEFTVFNVVNCQPPSNDLVGASYEAEAVENCRQYVDEVVARCQPRAILALGKTAFSSLTGLPSANILDLRGYILKSHYGIPLIGSFHPAFLLRGAQHLLGVCLHDLRRAVQVARVGVPKRQVTSYIISPTPADADAYLHRLRNDPTLPIAYDIETAGILGEDSDRIIQIQFSSGVGKALVLPWKDKWIEVAKEILATPNPKFDYNGRIFDRPILCANGVRFNGLLHDVMNAWGHAQPNFTSSKDDTHGDKGVPSRLMSLQSCVSFYYPEVKPWKHVAVPAWDGRSQLPLPLRLYGARDADYTYRVGVKLLTSLRKSGLYDGYFKYKLQLGDVLDSLSAHGLPVDRSRQDGLHAYIQSEEQKLAAELQHLIPEELKPFKSYKSWPKDLREAVKQSGEWKPKSKPLEYEVERYGYVRRDDTLIKLLPFNLNSSQQLLRYIEHKGYRIPLHLETRQPTTGKNEIEQLVAETDDDVLKMTQRMRKLTKLGGTYCEGDWIPGEDGRVHGTFRFGTASGQTSCTRPNIQQYPEHFDPKDLWVADVMKRVKSCIKAEDGYIFAKIDYRAAHAKMQGFLAEDAVYYRLADTDIHSYTTAHYVGVEDRNTLLELDDASLRRRLKEIKREYEYDRNYKLKRILYLMQFTGGAEKAFQILRAGFDSVVEVQQLMDMIKNLFPKTFIDFPAKIERQLHEHPWLISPFQHIRYFWDFDLQQATAYLPSNCFHAHSQAALIRLYKAGVFETYGACNWAHDSLWLHAKEESVDEGIATVKAEFERPSDVLTNSLGAFTCHADAMKGCDMANMCDA